MPNTLLPFCILLCSYMVSCKRYLLYDVFHGEGFNLRRDVYIRVSNLVRLLRQSTPDDSSVDVDWILVLPPWDSLPHWSTALKGFGNYTAPTRMLPWAHFFHLPSLAQVIPVMEFEDFRIKVLPTFSPCGKIDLTLHLFRSFEEDSIYRKNEVRFCTESRRAAYKAMQLVESDSSCVLPRAIDGPTSVLAENHDCITGDLQPLSLAKFLKSLTQSDSTAKPISSILLTSAETIIHGLWSEWSPEYWTVRRSMVFSTLLRKIGDEFRAAHLNSTDVSDRTVQPTPVAGGGDGSAWLRTHWPLSPAVGGPYVSIHWRLGDYVLPGENPWKNTPSPERLANQLIQVLSHWNSPPAISIKTVFLATDGTHAEVSALKHSLGPSFRVVQFIPTESQWGQLGPGGVAIVDQWICSHAAYFLGTNPSTFTFRIVEERTIMGFTFASTFNNLCANNGARLYGSLEPDERECEGLTAWPVVIEPEFSAPYGENHSHNEL
ncbi:unnamed protein product [Dicrocoelium dendriticum]|nr:unnamed protein product [Dicrocoelium dendriticum]